MSFSSDVASIVGLYLGRYCLLDWIDPDKLNWFIFSINSSAIPLLIANPEKIDWVNLSKNSAAISLLAVNKEKIDRDNLSGNPSIFELRADPLVVAELLSV